MFKILIAEQEVAVLREISTCLANGKFQIDEAVDGLRAHKLVARNSYDGIIMDRSLPQFSTLDICKQLRLSGSQSAIFVIASRDSHDDQERVLDAGADEYMVRPFEPRQLFAKLRAAIRRRQPHGYVDTLTCGPISIDRNTHCVLVNNEPLTLRPMEYKLLEFLMVNQERIISAEELWENVWHQKSLPSDTVRAHINSLRKRLRTKTDGQWIQTIQSRGYRIVQSNHRLEPVRIRA